MKGLRKLIPGRRGKNKRNDQAADNTSKNHEANSRAKEKPVDQKPSNDKNPVAMTVVQNVKPESTPAAQVETSLKPPIQQNTDKKPHQPNHKNADTGETETPNIKRPVSNRFERSLSCETTSSHFIIEDGPAVVKSYDAIPILEQTKLPRGGVSMETEAVGRVQFGIPPETIKDSMRLGLPVPAVYIVPVERFCREMGPALGVNLAEFEFPAYFNFFVSKKQCTLVVDSQDAESNIRRVFSETLLGPDQFRRKQNPISYEEEDFDPDFPREAIPNFQKELEYFRIGPDGKELTLETLLNFRHFETPGETGIHENLGIPPPLENSNLSDNASLQDSISTRLDDVDSDNEGINEEKMFDRDLKRMEQKSQWTYSQARWIGDVSTVWPSDATEEHIENRSCKRIEIFKMPGGTEYILHDVDENNHIVGKAKFSGHVKVSESMSVDGFGGKSMLEDTYGEEENDNDDDDDDDDDEALDKLNKSRSTGRTMLPPTFNPPSFGVTVLGNSHGFDKSGSTSGYVLWINGRGVMIDPPPYSSATLEREGIRPRTIVGIILTHCHADHDAGAFQKVLTGSPVVVITTPTIYKSFIQKYAALSALSPALLMHSHRHKPAIIGSPLRFQGATFRFTYTLHSIPCVGFRVEWRGRSMVFTADHFNSPPAIEKLEQRGVLSKARADDLRNLPLQDTDLLLHEAGAPPIHTPLEVLMQLPERVKRKLYVVHTSALPNDCDLRVAPTGTAGTIRLDQGQNANPQVNGNYIYMNKNKMNKRSSISIEDDLFPSPWSSASNEYETSINEDEPSSGGMMDSSFNFAAAGMRTGRKQNRSNSLLVEQNMDDTGNLPPLVSLRAASSTDAWFILNLLSAVPFLTSLSYASTMEVLETARVEAYCKDTVVVPSSRRNHVLCVVWEGTCVEREKGNISDPYGRDSPCQSSSALLPIRQQLEAGFGAVWHAGDWTGPISLQPEKRLSGDSTLQPTHDVVAMSLEGVKVITVEFSNLHAILKSGSSLYRKYLERRNQQRKNIMELGSNSNVRNSTAALLVDAKRNLNVLELLDSNSALRRLSAVQKRHLESLAEGPVSFQPGERLWRAGAPVDKAFVVVSGTASFVPKRRNAGSAGLPPKTKVHVSVPKPDDASSSSASNEFWVNSKSSSIGETMRLDAITAIRELKIPESEPSAEESSDNQVPKPKSKIQPDISFTKHPSAHDVMSSPILDGDEFARLSRVLQKDADSHGKLVDGPGNGDAENGFDLVEDESLQNLENICLDLENESITDSVNCSEGNTSHARRRSSRARFANKVLGRLYNRRAFTGGLVFSRGHFLGDVSKMVAGRLCIDTESDFLPDTDEETNKHRYGFGEKSDNSNSPNHAASDIIHEHEGDELVVHNSTLTAGKNGCVVLVFPKSTLCPFLDEYPGLLLSLLGTQVVV